MQAIIRYGFFIPLGADLTLNNFLFILLMTATVCIAAAGNIINNICNFKFDSINLPKKVSIVNKVTEKNANHLFIIFNSIGVGLGFYRLKFAGVKGRAQTIAGMRLPRTSAKTVVSFAALLLVR